jgi:phage gp36-like protein
MRCALVLACAVLAIAPPASSHAQTVELITARTAAAVVPYIELSELKGKIPDRDLIAALDDNQDGVVDADVWEQIQADVQTEIDGVLGQRYATPFTAPLPAVVKLAALRFAIEAVYQHRQPLGEKSPERANANAMRAKLGAIAKGDQPLAPEKQRARPSGSVISSPARTHSDRPAI